MIQLFDYYNQETQDLHDSLLAAGYDCPTIVIEANGFLPDDMISPYTYFLGDKEGVDRFTMPVRPRVAWSNRWIGWIKKASCD